MGKMLLEGLEGAKLGGREGELGGREEKKQQN